MQNIRLREAKARLSAAIDAAEHGESTVNTRHRRPAAVMLSYAEWQRLSAIPSFADLSSACPAEEGDFAERDRSPICEVDL